MSRRRKGQPVSGWVVIDKPAGMTSTDVVNTVRRALDAQKAGHAGTLDPAATYRPVRLRPDNDRGQQSSSCGRD